MIHPTSGRIICTQLFSKKLLSEIVLVEETLIVEIKAGFFIGLETLRQLKEQVLLAGLNIEDVVKVGKCYHDRALGLPDLGEKVLSNHSRSP